MVSVYSCSALLDPFTRITIRVNSSGRKQTNTHCPDRHCSALLFTLELLLSKPNLILGIAQFYDETGEIRALGAIQIRTWPLSAAQVIPMTSSKCWLKRKVGKAPAGGPRRQRGWHSLAGGGQAQGMLSKHRATPALPGVTNTSRTPSRYPGTTRGSINKGF